jgi:ornithine cyclodeaminase/alanine dehydrogenase-like protein (mu-crystallin family)
MVGRKYPQWEESGETVARPGHLSSLLRRKYRTSLDHVITTMSNHTHTVRVLSGRDVDVVSASFTPQDLQSTMAHVFYTLSNVTDPMTGVTAPHRTALDMRSHRALFMPARIADIGTTIKIVSVPSVPGDTRGLPATTLVLDEDTGAVKAVINARSLTALRTAAGMS